MKISIAQFKKEFKGKNVVMVGCLTVNKPWLNISESELKRIKAEIKKDKVSKISFNSLYMLRTFPNGEVSRLLLNGKKLFKIEYDNLLAIVSIHKCGNNYTELIYMVV